MVFFFWFPFKATKTQVTSKEHPPTWMHHMDAPEWPGNSFVIGFSLQVYDELPHVEARGRIRVGASRHLSRGNLRLVDRGLRNDIRKLRQVHERDDKWDSKWCTSFGDCPAATFEVPTLKSQSQMILFWLHLQGMVITPLFLRLVNMSVPLRHSGVANKTSSPSCKKHVRRFGDCDKFLVVRGSGEE